jgi:hypothetical protein
MKLKTIRSDRGATDPILVIAAIAVSLVLLVGGSFAVSGIITNGHDLNAKSDLNLVQVAETAHYAGTDGYVAYKQGGTATQRALEDSGIGFTPTEGGKIAVLVSPVANASGAATVTGQTKWGFATVSRSASTKKQVFLRTSDSQAIAEVDTAATTWKLKGTNATQTTATLKSLGITLAQLKAALG